jgi:hypothetical protein
MNTVFLQDEHFSLHMVQKRARQLHDAPIVSKEFW